MSKFTAKEKNFVIELLDIGEVDKHNVDEHLEPRVFQFLHKNGNLNTIVDQISFKPKSKYRYYESLFLTKFITEQINWSKILENILDNITGRFAFY